MEAGPNAATSLSELASVQSGFEGLHSSWVQLLSHQAVLGRSQPVAAVILQRTLADSFLTAQTVRDLILFQQSAGQSACPCVQEHPTCVGHSQNTLQLVAWSSSACKI